MANHNIQKVNINEIITTVSSQCNMSNDEFKYYMMKILISDSNLGSGFSDLIVTAKLLYSNEAKAYTDSIARMEESFRKMHEIVDRLNLENELLRNQHSLKSHSIDKPQLKDRSITHQIKD